MKLLEHFDHPERKQDKEHFLHLIQIASADGIIDDSELRVLSRIGKNLGLTDPEIKDLFDTSKQSEYVPPYELTERFEQLFRITQMILADDTIANEEIHRAKMLGLKSGFSEEDLTILLPLLIDGVKSGQDVEDLFALYKKRRKS
ncbi:MAG: hypothetical protein WC384_10890 [Prolixibacteraceae bacterium]|jgi:uncharacterized tellurite resistance protein B-like protein